MSTLQDRNNSRAGELSKNDPYYQPILKEKYRFSETYEKAEDALAELKEQLQKNPDSKNKEEKEQIVSKILKPLQEATQQLWYRLDQAEKSHQQQPELISELRRVKNTILAREATFRADAFETSGNSRAQLEETDRSLMYSLVNENTRQKNLLALLNTKGAGFPKEYDGQTGRETTSLFKQTTLQLEGLTEIDAGTFASAYGRLPKAKRERVIDLLQNSIDLSIANSADPSKANKRVDLMFALAQKEGELAGGQGTPQAANILCAANLARASTFQKAGNIVAAIEATKEAMANAEKLVNSGFAARGIELMVATAGTAISNFCDLAFDKPSVLGDIRSLVAKVENTLKSKKSQIVADHKNGNEIYSYLRERCANLRITEAATNAMAFQVNEVMTKLLPELKAEYGKEFPAKVEGLQTVMSQYSAGEGAWGQVKAGGRNLLAAMSRQEGIHIAVGLAISVLVGFAEGGAAGSAVGPEGTVGGAAAGAVAGGVGWATARMAGRAVLGSIIKNFLSKGALAGAAYLVTVSTYNNSHMIVDGLKSGATPAQGGASIAVDFLGLLP